ncbi:MAG: ornithine carbamoyltransferase [Phycisphaerales bacterium]
MKKRSTAPTSPPSSLTGADLLTIRDLGAAQLEAVLATAAACKAAPAKFARSLAGQSVIMLFEKPSLRTRVSFEVGIFRLGGHGLYYDHSKERIGERETTHDYAKNLERFGHAIVARVFSQKVLEELAQHSRVPVINALSNEHHPCQALADMLTIREHFGTVKGKRIVYLGDGNNVCISLVQAAAKLGAHAVAICPDSHVPDAAEMAAAAMDAEAGGGSVKLTADVKAVKNADVIYTDAWTSMHQTDAADRERAFAKYQVNAKLMARANKKAIFMHCLPAHRGQEVTNEVIDSKQSVVFDQAENRLWAQNGLLVELLGR